MPSVVKLSPMVAPFLVEAPGLKELERIKKDVGKIGKQIGDTIGNTGRKMTMGLTLPILGAAGASVKLSTDANRALANIGTLIPGQRQKLEGYRKDLDRLAVSTATPFETLADGLYQSISALGDGAQAMTALEVANKAATAGVADTKDAISLLSSVAKGYNDVSDSMINKTSDLAFMTVKLGVTTFPELAASMGKATPIASALGVSVEELFGSMATLTGVTGDTAEVSTQLSAIMGALLKGGDGLNKVFKKFGTKTGQEFVRESGGLINALKNIKFYTKGSDAEFANLLGRKEAILAGLALTGIQAENAATKINEMKNAVGATDAAFAEQTEGVNKSEHQFKQFIETLKSLGRSIGDKIIPILSRLGDRLKPLTDKIVSMDDATIEMLMKIAGIAAVIGPTLMVFGKMFSGISAIVGVLSGGSGLAGVLITLTGPLGAVIAGLIAAGAAVWYFWDELKPVRDAIKNEIIQMFGDLSIKTGGIKTDFSSLGETLKGFVKFAAPVWAVFAKIGINMATLPLRTIIWQFTKVVEVIKNVVKIFHSIKTAFGAVGDLIGLLWEAFASWFSNMEAKFPFLESVREIFQTIGDKIKFVVGGLKEVGEAFKNAPGVATDWIAEKAGALSGSLARFAADEKRDFSAGKKDNLDINIRVDSKEKTGVTARGKKAKIRGGDGAIMAPDGGI